MIEFVEYDGIIKDKIEHIDQIYGIFYLENLYSKTKLDLFEIFTNEEIKDILDLLFTDKKVRITYSIKDLDEDFTMCDFSELCFSSHKDILYISHKEETNLISIVALDSIDSMTTVFHYRDTDNFIVEMTDSDNVYIMIENI